MTQIIRRGVLNTLQASGGDFWKDSTAKQWGFISDGTTNTGGSVTPNPVPSLFEPIPYNKVLSYTQQASQAEVRQAALIGAENISRVASVAPTFETVVASRKYQLIGRPAQKDLEKTPKEFVFNYTAPATLTGTAQTDRDNMWTALKNKINAANMDVTAYVLYYFVTTAATTAAPTTATIGATVTQGTSNITAKLARSYWRSGALGAAVIDMYVYDVSSTAFNATAVNWTYSTPSGSVTQAAALPVAVGLALVDAAGYWSSSVSRGGITKWSINYGNASTGFQRPESVPALPAVHTAALTGYTEVPAAYSIGIANDMLARIANFNLDKSDMLTGIPDFVFDKLPTAGKTFTTVSITTKGELLHTSGQREEFEKIFVVYLDESNGTNLNNLITAIFTTAAADVFA